MTAEDLARVTEWVRLAEAATPGPWARITNPRTGAGALDGGALWGDAREKDLAFVAAARTAVPEMARMLREALDGIATVGEQREKWREVAASWEARAHEAMRLADVAAAELKRMREHGVHDIALKVNAVDGAAVEPKDGAS